MSAHTPGRDFCKCGSLMLCAAATSDEAFAVKRKPDAGLREALQRFVDLADLEYLGTEARVAHAVKVAREAIAKAEAAK